MVEVVALVSDLVGENGAVLEMSIYCIGDESSGFTLDQVYKLDDEMFEISQKDVAVARHIDAKKAMQKWSNDARAKRKARFLSI